MIKIIETILLLDLIPFGIAYYYWYRRDNNKWLEDDKYYHSWSTYDRKISYRWSIVGLLVIIGTILLYIWNST